VKLNLKAKSVWLAAGGVCLLVAIITLIVSMGRKSDDAAGEAAIPVAVAVVGKGSISDELSLTGNVEAVCDVDLYSKVTGRLEKLNSDAGDEVGKGEVVALIDKEDFEARLNQARAELDVARAELKKAAADLHKADKDRGRVLRLYEDGIESEDLFDQADTAYKAALASHDLAESNVWNREARLEQARILLDETTIESPLDGFVARKYVDAGAMITLSTPILKVVNIDAVDVVVAVPEVKLSYVKIGAPVNIKVDAYPHDIFSGKVVRISPWVDLKTRTSKVEVSIENPGYRLKPGMFARVTLELERRAGVPLIPKDAIIMVGSERAVYVVEGGAAMVKKVRTGLEKGNIIEVLDGIGAGEKIIVRGQSVVSDGKRVEVVREEDIF